MHSTLRVAGRVLQPFDEARSPPASHLCSRERRDMPGLNCLQVRLMDPVKTYGAFAVSYTQLDLVRKCEPNSSWCFSLKSSQRVLEMGSLKGSRQHLIWDLVLYGVLSMRAGSAPFGDLELPEGMNLYEWQVVFHSGTWSFTLSLYSVESIPFKRTPRQPPFTNVAYTCTS